MHPNNDQGIVMYTTDNFSEDEYIKSIGKLVGPKNVIFASSISNNRFCIYLSNKDIVNELLSNHSNIVINNSEVGICSLMNPAQNLILSNVSPTIPHELVKNALLKKNLKLMSPISFLKAEILDKEYTHVLSFRRQVLASFKKDEQISDAIIINHEDIRNKIFITQDNRTCNIYKEQYSTATKYPKENIDETLPSTSHSTTEKRPEEKPIMEEIFPKPLTQCSNTGEPQTSNNQNENSFTKPAKNIRKEENPTELPRQLTREEVFRTLKGEITYNEFTNMLNCARILPNENA